MQCGFKKPFAGGVKTVTIYNSFHAGALKFVNDFGYNFIPGLKSRAIRPEPFDS